MKQDYPFDAVILEPQIPATGTVIWLHGLGADGYDFYGIVPQLKLLDPCSVRFIFPHAPIREVTFNRGTKMRAWYDVHGFSKDSFEDEESIRQSEKTICDMIQYEENRNIPTNQVALAGFSQGGVIALQCGLRYPKPLGGILALSTYLPLAHTLDQEIHPANRSLSIFMAHGGQDNVIPIGWARHSRQVLAQYEYGVEWFEYPMAHTVCLKEIEDISAFLIKTLNLR